MKELELIKGYEKLNVMELELGFDWSGTKNYLETKYNDLLSEYEYITAEEKNSVAEEMEECIKNLIVQNVENFIGCKWEDAERDLRVYIIVDNENVDQETGKCIVDFNGDYSILSIEGKIIDNELIIDDEALIYKNCI